MTDRNEPINPIEPKGYIAKGLTKREYFAAMAMQGLCSNSKAYENLTDERLAEIALINADALINALNETE